MDRREESRVNILGNLDSNDSVMKEQVDAVF